MKGYKNREWLTKEYLEEGLSLAKVARLENVSPDTIKYWMKKFKIPVRSRVEVIALKKKRAQEVNQAEVLQGMDFEGEDDLASVKEFLENQKLFRNGPHLRRVLQQRALKEMKGASDVEYGKKVRLERERQRRLAGAPVSEEYTVENDMRKIQVVCDEPSKRKKR